MNFIAQYHAKLRSFEKTVKVIQSGNWVNFDPDQSDIRVTENLTDSQTNSLGRLNVYGILWIY